MIVSFFLFLSLPFFTFRDDFKISLIRDDFDFEQNFLEGQCQAKPQVIFQGKKYSNLFSPKIINLKKELTVLFGRQTFVRYQRPRQLIEQLLITLSLSLSLEVKAGR